MKIENKMDELKNHLPDDFWQKAFDEAAETPPPRVWDSIERRLDETDKPRIIPLWGFGLASTPVVWGTGIAASLALVLVGWWVINTQSATQSIARRQPSRPTSNVAVAPTTSKNSSVTKSSQHAGEAIASVNKPSLSPAQSIAVPATQTQPSVQSVARPGEVSIAQTTAKPVDKVNTFSRPTKAAATLRSSSTIATVTATDVMVPTTGSRIGVTSLPSSQNTAQNVAIDNVPSTKMTAAAFDLLTGKPLRMRSLGPIQRIVWFRPTELPMEPELIKEKRKKRELWASVSAMPGSFNPSVSIQSPQSSIANSFAVSTANTNKGPVNSQASFSVAYQAGAGVQLTDRWSVESGIGYLAGHSTIEAPIQSATYGFIQGSGLDRTTTVSNLYVDALRSSSSNKSANSAPQASFDILATNNAYLSPNNYNSQARQTLTNDYQYMQVPIQVGYQLRPRKRLSLALLGGLITNIFVRNTVGNDVVITATDGVYRPVSLAATMGARFRYRPSGRWSASMAGLYQPSLGSGTQTESQVQSHPTSTGMSFGVDYHF